MASTTRRDDPDNSSLARTRRESAGQLKQTRIEASPGVPGTRRETDTAAEPRTHGFRRQLPSGLAARYRIVEEFPARGGEADCFLIANAQGERFFAKVYRKGINPKFEVFERLSRSAEAHVIKLYEHGQSDSYSYEVLEYAPNGTLGDLMTREGPRLTDSLVMEVLKELQDALTHVHALAIEHRDLKPENVLVRLRTPLDLVLTDFGIASVMASSVRYTHGHRTAHYAPPEAASGSVFHRAWDYWSLGMILVELLVGRHPFTGLNDQVVGMRLATMPTDNFVDGVADPRWRKLCRGLLRRDPKKRWGGAEVRKWLLNPNDPSLVVAEDVAVHTLTSVRPFPFKGQNFHTKEQLAEALAANWDDALGEWQSGRITRWIRDDLRAFEAERALDRIDKLTGTDAENQLFRAIRAISPELPLSFRGLELTEEKLNLLADHTASDAHAQAVLRALYQSKILSAADDILGKARFVPIEQKWGAAIDEYERKRRDIGSLPDLNEELLAILLACSTPGSHAIQGLRERAKKVASANAMQCPWFTSLGHPAKSSAAALLAMTLAASAAEDWTRREREALRQRAAARTRTVIGAISGAIIGAPIGGIGGFIAALLIALFLKISSIFVASAYDLVQPLTLGAIILGIGLGMIIGASSAINSSRNNPAACGIFAVVATALISLGLYYVSPHIVDIRVALRNYYSFQTRSADAAGVPKVESMDAGEVQIKPDGRWQLVNSKLVVKTPVKNYGVQVVVANANPKQRFVVHLRQGNHVLASSTGVVIGMTQGAVSFLWDEFPRLEDGEYNFLFQVDGKDLVVLFIRVVN